MDEHQPDTVKIDELVHHHGMRGRTSPSTAQTPGARCCLQQSGPTYRSSGQQPRIDKPLRLAVQRRQAHLEPVG
ncbi:MAG: hypothetical protein ACRDMV_11275 [Streptosporangiales bacterium]